MKKLLLLISIVPSFALAEGPLFSHKNTITQQEFENNYQDHRRFVNKSSLPFLNVKDYGAKGDGTTDDKNSVQNALNTARSDGGGIVFFPAGNYLISTFLTTYSSITMMGVNAKSSIIKSGNNSNYRLLNGTGNGDLNIILKDLTFDMNGVNQSGSTAVSFGNTVGLQIYRCRFINAYDSLFLLSGSPNTSININSVFEDVEFDGTNQQLATDLVDIGSGSNIQMTRIYGHNAKASSGIPILSIAIIDGFSITDSWLDGKGNGLPISLLGIRGGKVDNCEILNSPEVGIRLWKWTEIAPVKDLDGVKIINSRIHDNAWSGIETHFGDTSDAPPLNVSVVNCEIWNNQKNAINLMAADGFLIQGCNLHHNSLSGTGQYAVLNATGYFTVDGQIREVQFYDNHIYDSTTSNKQTLLFNFSYVDTFISKGNIFSQIITTMTASNTSNYYIQEQGLLSTTDITKQDIFGVTGLSNSGSFTRNMSDASGDSTVTGVGFAPKNIQFFALAGSTVTSWGFHTSGKNSAVSTYGYSSGIPLYTAWTANSIGLHEGASGGYQAAVVSSYQPDGFTLTWTKGGSPSAETFRVFWLAQR